MSTANDVRVTVRVDKNLKKDAESITNAFNSAVQTNIKTNQQMRMPVAKYDELKKMAYLESADGTKEYVHG